MKKPLKKSISKILAGILFIPVCLISCDKTEYELLDPGGRGVWTHYTMENDGLPGNEIDDIKIDIYGNLWVTFWLEGVGVLSGGEWTFYNRDNSGLHTNSVTVLEPTPEGGMFIGTSDGIYYRSPGGQWRYYRDPNSTKMWIYSIKAGSDGTVWVGTKSDGFYYFSGSDTVQILVSGHETVNAIEEDRFGNIWLGTENGLWELTDFDVYLFTTEDGLPDNDVTALYFDSHDRMWIGNSIVSFVSYYDYDSEEINSIYLMNGVFNLDVRDIHEDMNGDFWFALWWDGLIKYDGVIAHSYKIYNGFYDDDVNAIEVDSNGDLWFGLYSYGLVKYTLPLEKR